MGRTGHPGGSLEGESGSRGAAGSRPEEGGGLGRLTRLCWLHVGVPSDLGTCTVAEKSAFHTRLQGLVYPADWEGSDKIRFKWKEKPCLGGEIARAGMSSGQ